jgi:hypothetical protein
MGSFQKLLHSYLAVELNPLQRDIVNKSASTKISPSSLGGRWGWRELNYITAIANAFL